MSAKSCALAFMRQCYAFLKNMVPFAGTRISQSWMRQQTSFLRRFANPTNLNGKSGWIFVNDPDNVQYISVANAKNYTTRYLPVRSCSCVCCLKEEMCVQDIYKFATNGKGILGSQGEYNRKHRAMCQPTFHCAPVLKRFATVLVDK